MLNNGFIKCENTGKKTRKYAVKLTDLIEFIVDSEKHPQKYVTPYAQFSTAKYGNTHKPRPRKTMAHRLLLLLRLHHNKYVQQTHQTPAKVLQTNKMIIVQTNHPEISDSSFS